MNEPGFADDLQALRNDRTRGASELARAALDLAGVYARTWPARDTEALLDALSAAAACMARARPSMAPLHNLLRQWTDALGSHRGQSLEQVRDAAAGSARAIRVASERAGADAADNTAALVGSGKTVITHSLSSTVRAVFERLAGGDVKAIVTESRPLFEGRDLARWLSGLGVPTVLITDAQMGLSVPRADLALVGADCLLPDGSVVNKAGTCLLALAARHQGVPFYVCCESFKRRTPEMGEVVLEQMDPNELGTPELAGVEVVNAYFDLTPAALVTAWIDEQGVHESL